MRYIYIHIIRCILDVILLQPFPNTSGASGGTAHEPQARSKKALSCTRCRTCAQGLGFRGSGA